VVSFADLWEQIENKKAQNSPLMSSGEDLQALTVLRAAKDMHKENQPQFFDEFISLCSNAEGMAQLLGVSPEKVRSWPARIREVKEKLDKSNLMDTSVKEKKQMIPTGDNGAFTVNSDPLNIGDFS
jgi:hypothetical protein